MRIRLATKQDASDIAKIHVNTWQSAYKGIMSSTYLESMSIEEKTEQWSKILSIDSVGINLVIESKDSIVGFCVFGPIRDIDLSNENAGELVAINISPKYWRNGFGSKAIKYIIKASIKENWEALYLWVLKENTQAIQVYEALGFAPEGGEKRDKNLTGYELHEIRYVKKL